MTTAKRSKKKRKVFVGYRKIYFYNDGNDTGWEYYKRYSDGTYWYWHRDWGGPGNGAWCWGGRWYNRDRRKKSVRVSKMEMIIVNGLESVNGCKGSHRANNTDG